MQKCYLYNLKYTDELFGIASLELFAGTGHILQNQERYVFLKTLIDCSEYSYIESVSEVIIKGTYQELIDTIPLLRLPQKTFAIEKTHFGYEQRIKMTDILPIAEIFPGAVNLKKPELIYQVNKLGEHWILSKILSKSNRNWFKHKQKPINLSCSLPHQLARGLVNAVMIGHKTFLDCGCGSGTLMMEACSMGFNVTGVDQSYEMIKKSQENLKAFHYNSQFFKKDAREIQERFDGCVIDFPYGKNLIRKSDIEKEILLNLKSKIKKIITLTSTDERKMLNECGFEIIHYSILKGNSLDRHITLMKEL